MLSYRHSFHAGNHADVLKHLVLVELLSYLTKKDKRLWYIETHAGAGRYRLDQDGPATRAEFHDGIERLWRAPGVPPECEPYLEIIRAMNHSDSLQFYPGSPHFARALVRPSDRLWLHELHPADFESLRDEFLHDRSARVFQQDGFAGLKSLLPPEPRRALVVIDPSYELHDDYAQVTAALGDARRRFANGVYAIWYPLLKRNEAEALPGSLLAVAGERWLNVQLQVREGRDQHAGLFGSGMFIVNPPHTVPAWLNSVMPRLTELLAQDKAASYDVSFNIP